MNKNKPILYSGACLAALFATIIACLTIDHFRSEAFQQQISIAQNIAKLEEQAVERMIQNIDYALQVSIDEIEHHIS